MKTWRLTRLLSTLGVLLFMASIPVRAGEPWRIFIPDDGDLGTLSDDLIRTANLHWNDGDDLLFLYRRVLSTDTILLPSLNDNNLRTVDIVDGIGRAIETWNDAEFSDFRIGNTGVLPSDVIQNPLTGREILRAELDGFNLITFIQSDAVGTDVDIAAPIITYFYRDFDLAELIQDGSLTDFYWTQTEDGIEVDLDFDDATDILLEQREYEAGEIIDVDITFNPNVTPFLRIWPENRGEVPPEDDRFVDGSLDIQALVTTQLGYALGLGRSMIHRAVMNPFWSGGDDPYTHDPYARRMLSFDDEIAIGRLYGQDFDGGAISGQVFEGVSFDGVFNTDLTIDDFDGTDDDFVVGVPVLLCVRPTQLLNSSVLANDKEDFIITGDPEPDDRVSFPDFDPLNENAGTWRVVAQVISGRDPSLNAGRAGVSDLIPIPNDDDELDPPAANNPSLEDLVVNDPGQPEARIDSAFEFPGLPSLDNSGTTIAYAVYLDGDLNDTGSFEPSLHAVHEYFRDVDSADNEFYGGAISDTTPVGQGFEGADIDLLGNDAGITNEYLTASLDDHGRIGARINNGPTLLAESSDGIVRSRGDQEATLATFAPRSFLYIVTPQGNFNNRFGYLGETREWIADDLAQLLRGTFARSGDFVLRSNVEFTADGGEIGRRSGMRVEHVLVNDSVNTQTYSLVQVLETDIFGRRNPVYDAVARDPVGGILGQTPIVNSSTFAGADIPAEILFKTSAVDPLFTGHVTIRGFGLRPPTYVTVSEYDQIFQNHGLGLGPTIRGADSRSFNTVIALSWNDFTLAPGEQRLMSYIVGYLTPGRRFDAAVAYSATVEQTGEEDDPQEVDTVVVREGQVNDSVDIITNNGLRNPDYPGDTQLVEDGYAAGPLFFILSDAAFRTAVNGQIDFEGNFDKDWITLGGKLGDLDNDGDLDCVTANWGGGSNPLEGSLNRIYINTPRVDYNGTTRTIVFVDETFGQDGQLGTEDDRLAALGHIERTAGVVLADFDMDGYLDIFFTNAAYQGMPDVYRTNRLYFNEGEGQGYLNQASGTLDHAPRAGHFVDVSADWLPGLLNRGWDNSVDGQDSPFRAAAGDIDNDGDPDLIISQQNPFTDADDYRGLPASIAWVDSSPRDEDFPFGDGIFQMDADLFSESLRFSERVLINTVRNPDWYDPTPLGVVDPILEPRVQLRQSTIAKGYGFLDETLGTDDRAGTVYVTAWTNFVPPTTPTTLLEVDLDPFIMAIDRMPPADPGMINVTALDLETFEQEVDTVVVPRMGSPAIEPLLGPIFRSGGLDLISVRYLPDERGISSDLPLTYTSGTKTLFQGTARRFGTDDTVIVGNEQAYFRNVDLFTNDLENFYEGNEAARDGLQDGYFMCFNYGFDWGAQAFTDGLVNRLGNTFQVEFRPDGPGYNGLTSTTAFASALLPLTTAANPDPNATGDFGDPLTVWPVDPFPLMIGFPDGHPGDYTPDTGSTELDIVQGVVRGGYAAVIGDFEHRGVSRSFFAPDNDAVGGAFLRWSWLNDDDPDITGEGVQRGQQGDFGGRAAAYFSGDFAPGPFGDVRADTDRGNNEWVPNGTIRTAPNSAEPYDAVAADFDHDGDLDIFLARTTDQGVVQFAADGSFNVVPADEPVDDLFLLNSASAVGAEFGVLSGHSIEPDTQASLVATPQLDISMGCDAGDVDGDGDIDVVVFNAFGSDKLLLNQIYGRPPDVASETDPTLFREATREHLPPVIGGGVLAGQPTLRFLLEGFTVGIASGDFDLDGNPDIAFAEGGRFSENGDYLRMLFNRGPREGQGGQIFKPAGAPYPAPRLKNDQTGNPEISQRPPGTLDTGGYLVDVVAGDIEGDGDLDLLVVRTGTATDQVSGDSLSGPQVLLNVDRDTFEDNNQPDADAVGDGIFVPAGLPALFDPGRPPEELQLKRQGERGALADFDGDGDLDIFVANRSDSGGAPNVLLLNVGGATPVFSDVTETNLPRLPGVEPPRGVPDDSRDIGLGDFDHDGDIDIVVANQTVTTEQVGFRMLLNNGSAVFTDAMSTVTLGSEFLLTHPRGVGVGDFDLVGEWTEDANYNGVLDPGEDLEEDLNGNGVLDPGEDLDGDGRLDPDGVLDWIDRPNESEDIDGDGRLDVDEDANANGVLDPGEDLDGDGRLDIAEDLNGNGLIDPIDRNSDGFITRRRAGVWEGSLDLFIAFDGELPVLLLNDPSNIAPGTFNDVSALRLDEDLLVELPMRRVDVGDIYLDGSARERTSGPDIAVALNRGGVTRHALLMRNTRVRVGTAPDGRALHRWGYFEDMSNELPFPWDIASVGDLGSDGSELGGPVPGVNPESVIGWANDVQLLDIEGDGDLDLVVGCLANGQLTAVVGTYNIVYINRQISRGWNRPGSPFHVTALRTPYVYWTNPQARAPGEFAAGVEIVGENLDPGMQFAFSGEGITVRSAQFIDSHRYRLVIDVAEDAPLGTRRILLYNPLTGAAVQSGFFSVYEQLPSPLFNALDRTNWPIYR